MKIAPSNTNFNSRVRLEGFNPSKGLSRGASKFKEISWYTIKVFFFLSAIPYPTNFKIFLLRLYGAEVGKNITLKPRVNIHFPWKLKIGNNVWIGEESFLLNFEELAIGNNVCVSQRVFLCGGNHNFKDPTMPYRNGPISLRDGCWVGACCFIGPGVCVGEDTVLTVGSIVTSSVGSNLVCRKGNSDLMKVRWI